MVEEELSPLAEVSTTFGDGYVLDIRVSESDGLVVHVIKLKLGGTIYAASPGNINMKLKTSSKDSGKKAGEVVHCAPFGFGKVLGYQEDNQMYVVKLAYGTLYTPAENLSDQYTAEIVKLNAAYEALEKMRLLNFEVSCHELGVKFDPTRCIHCLKTRRRRKSSIKQMTSLFSNSTAQCLICASPTCKTHSCSKFRKEGNTVCIDCIHLYNVDFALDIITTTSDSEKSELFRKMLDVYDRTLLMLKFSSQYIDKIAYELEKSKRMKNKFGIGSSSIGMVSGSLGLAATAALLAPTAAVSVPSLVIASIFFGGTSSAMQTGVEFSANNSKPNIVANRIIALYGMSKAILRTCDTLRGVMARHPKIQTLEAMHPNDFGANLECTTEPLIEGGIDGTVKADADNRLCQTSNTLAKNPIGKGAFVSETSTAGGKNARFVARSGVNSVSLGSKIASGSSAASAGGTAIVSTASSTVAASTAGSSAAVSAGAASVGSVTTAASSTAAASVAGSSAAVSAGAASVGSATTAASAAGSSAAFSASVASVGGSTAAASTAGSSAAVSAGVASVGGSTAAVSGASTAATSSISAGSATITRSAMTVTQFAAFAGGALSAAVLVAEVYGMSKLIQNIRKGSLCPKADLLRKIKSDIGLLPETKLIEVDCNEIIETLGEPLSIEGALLLLTDLLGPDGGAADCKKKLKCNRNKKLTKKASYSSPDTACPEDRLVYGKDDALFGSIEKMQGQKSFGSVLDAGTGLHSLRWIATLAAKGMIDFCAVTADKNIQTVLEKEAELLGVAHLGRIVRGNWFENTTTAAAAEPLTDQLLQFPDDSFDTILADYVSFSPCEDLILPSLKRLLKPGGRLYIVGLEPIPVKEKGDSNIICKVSHVRDACAHLCGHRRNQEYPLSWVKRQVLRLSAPSEHGSLKLLTIIKFPVLYRHDAIVNQINVARSKLPHFNAAPLEHAMAKTLDDLERQSFEATQASPTGRISQGFDYVVVAEKGAARDNNL